MLLVKKVKLKFKAHLHNDLVSADTVSLLVVMSYLEAQSVHFPPKNLTRSNHLKGYISKCSSAGHAPRTLLMLLGYLLTAPLLQKNIGETLTVHPNLVADIHAKRQLYRTPLKIGQRGV